MSEQELLTVAEAAAIFRVTLQTIRNWIEWGKLPALRVGRRFLVRREHIEALLDQAQAETAPMRRLATCGIPASRGWSSAGPCQPRRHSGRRSARTCQADTQTGLIPYPKRFYRRTPAPRMVFPSPAVGLPSTGGGRVCGGSGRRALRASLSGGAPCVARAAGWKAAVSVFGLDRVASWGRLSPSSW